MKMTDLRRTFFFYQELQFAQDSAYTPQKMKFSITGFFSKCDQIRSFLWIWSHLLKKSLMKNFIFCAVLIQFSIIYGNWDLLEEYI